MVEQLESCQYAIHCRRANLGAILGALPNLATPSQLEILIHAWGNFIEPISTKKPEQNVTVGCVQFASLWAMLLLRPFEKFRDELAELRGDVLLRKPTKDILGKRILNEFVAT